MKYTSIENVKIIETAIKRKNYCNRPRQGKTLKVTFRNVSQPKF